MLLFLGEKQMLINLTFFTVKFSKDTEAATLLRQTVGLFPKVEDGDWCAPDNLPRGEDVTEKSLFWNTFDFTKAPLHTAVHISLLSVFLCWSVVRILSRVLLKLSTQRGWGKGGCLTLTVKKTMSLSPDSYYLVAFWLPRSDDPIPFLYWRGWMLAKFDRLKADRFITYQNGFLFYFHFQFHNEHSPRQSSQTTSSSK